MRRKFFIVANPAAGRRKISNVLRDVREFFGKEDIPFDIYETSFEKRGHLTVRENLDSSYSDMLIIGGDGSINEAINGIETPVDVSFLPAGTGDDFVKTLLIGNNTEERLHTALHGSRHKIDLGVCNGRRFINGVGIGFDGQIGTDMQRKKIPVLTGQAKYYFHVLQILSTYRERLFSGTLDGQNFEDELILMTIAKGTTFGGGFQLTPTAQLDDGFLHICTVGKLSPLRRYLNIPKLQTGRHSLLQEVRMTRAKKITIEANPLLEGHIDGEVLGNPPLEISVLPSALSIRANGGLFSIS